MFNCYKELLYKTMTLTKAKYVRKGTQIHNDYHACISKHFNNRHLELVAN